MGNLRKPMLAAIRDSLKSAGSLVVKQAERTKLAQFTLPAAFAELGRACYEDGSRRGEFVKYFEALDTLFAEKGKIDEAKKTRPTAEKLLDKAKNAASDVADVVRGRAEEGQFFRAAAALGEAVYPLSGPAGANDPLSSRISSLKQSLAALDGEIKSLADSKAFGHVTMKKALLGVALACGVLALLWTMMPRSISPPVELCYTQDSERFWREVLMEQQGKQRNFIFRSIDKGNSGWVWSVHLQGIKELEAFQSIIAKYKGLAADMQKNPKEAGRKKIGTTAFHEFWFCPADGEPHIEFTDPKNVMRNGRSLLGDATISSFEAFIPKAQSMPKALENLRKYVQQKGPTKVSDESVAKSPPSAPPANKQQKASASPSEPGLSEVRVAIEHPPNRSNEYFVYVPEQNGYLSNMKCFKTEAGELIFKFDLSGWHKSVYQGWPLIIRLFDRNGNYLTHFTTERYALEGREPAAILEHKKIRELKNGSNTLSYNISMRDLRETEYVEISFLDTDMWKERF